MLKPKSPKKAWPTLDDMVEEAREALALYVLTGARLDDLLCQVHELDPAAVPGWCEKVGIPVEHGEGGMRFLFEAAEVTIH